MKAMANIIIVALLVAGTVGCTPTKTAMEPDKVKCAFCEYTAPGSDAHGPG